ncbi:MAG: Hsp20/alpha crystallin family protein [Isosphaeraceae bacterium]
MATDKIQSRHVLFLPAISTPCREAWQPRADIYRMAGGWLVKLELAGVRLEDVKLTARGSTLTVRGTRRDVYLHECLDCHSLEIAYSQFERILELPGMSEKAEIAASFQDGMLIVRVVTEGRSR